MIKIELTSTNKSFKAQTQEVGENCVAIMDRGDDTAIIMVGSFSDGHIMRCLDTILEELCPRLLEQLSEEARMYYHVRKLHKLDEMLDGLDEDKECQCGNCKPRSNSKEMPHPGPVGGLDVILNQILKGMMTDGSRKN